MVQCAGYEPTPPTEGDLFEVWCRIGHSGKPVQEHLGESGTILWVNNDGSLCVQFTDGDERLLYDEEIERD